MPRDYLYVLYQTTQAAAQQRGRAFRYPVVPRYGRPVRRELLARLAVETNPQAAAKRRVIEAEQVVPLNLICIFQEVEPATRKPIGKVQVITVPNPIEQNSLADYQTAMKQLVLNINTKATEPALLQVGFNLIEANLILDKLAAGVAFRNRKHLLKEVPVLNKAFVDNLYDRGSLHFN